MLLCSVGQSEDSDCNRNKLSYRNSRHVITCISPHLSMSLHMKLAHQAVLDMEMHSTTHGFVYSSALGL